MWRRILDGLRRRRAGIVRQCLVEEHAQAKSGHENADGHKGRGGATRGVAHEGMTTVEFYPLLGGGEKIPHFPERCAGET